MNTETMETLRFTIKNYKMREMLISGILTDIKALWDEEGFGNDDAISEPLYRRLCAAIGQLTPIAEAGRAR